MSLEQFLEKLAETPREWYQVIGDARIRCGEGAKYRCPIAAVAGKYDVSSPLTYANVIGLPVQIASEIVEASDSDDLYPELRAKILKACGL